MSHQPERKEKDCLNCGANVYGRYCHVCGQENIIVKQGFFSLAKHFVYDIFHFDGKFFDTLKKLVAKPGLVPKEYIAGRRTTYLDPIRMYLFTSAVFFLIFFSVRDVSQIIIQESQGSLTRAERFEAASKITANLNKQFDSTLFFKLGLLMDSTKTLTLSPVDKNNKNDSFFIQVRNGNYHIVPSVISKEAYKKYKSDSWFERNLERKWEAKKKKYGDDERQVISEFLNEFMHKMPYLLFLSLPFFALILKLLYIRKKKHYYSDHAVFTLYHYIFVFILLLFLIAADALENVTGWRFFKWIGVILLIWWPLYLLFGMKRFYQQGWLKTTLKFLLVSLLGFITMLILFVVFIIFSFIT